MNILELPDELLEQIFEYLSYEEIAKKRLVSKKVDDVCQRLLNRGFTKAIKRHSVNLKRIKSLLPRRESERRNHSLARHADILTCIETRISMLSMTYTKYMEMNLCCFIPGKVIDEIFRILKLLETTNKPLRAHEVLQELRDISSMAIEHFDEKIAHLLKKSFLLMNQQKCKSLASPGTSNIPRIGGVCEQRNLSDQFGMVVGGSLEGISPQSQAGGSCSQRQGERCWDAKMNRVLMARMKDKYKKAFKKLNRMIQIQNSQARQLRESSAHISELDAQVVELKKRLEEVDAKNREISANIIQITGEPSNATASTASVTAERPRNIKPRTTLLVKRRLTESTCDVADERGREETDKKPKLE